MLFLKYFITERGQKFVYMLRTDIPVRKSILYTGKFLNSKNRPQYDKMLRDELIGSSIFKGLYLDGYKEWNFKNVASIINLYNTGSIKTKEYISQLIKTYRENVEVK